MKGSPHSSTWSLQPPPKYISISLLFKKAACLNKRSELVREPWIVARECWIATLIHHQRPNDPKLDYYVHDKNRRTFILIHMVTTYVL